MTYNILRNTNATLSLDRVLKAWVLKAYTPQPQNLTVIENLMYYNYVIYYGDELCRLLGCYYCY